MYYMIMSYEEADRRERIGVRLWFISLITLIVIISITTDGIIALLSAWMYAVVSLAYRVARSELIGNEGIAEDVGIDRGGCIRYRTRTSRLLHTFAPFVLPYFYVRRLVRRMQRAKL